MAEVKTLEPELALYDYVLYFECASKDWKKGAKKTTINGEGNLLELINWNSTYSYDPDDAGGKTLFGVTESAWQNFVQKYPEKGYSKDLNTMGRQGWFDQIDWFWNVNSSAGKCANYACAFLMFQMAWGGFGSNSQSKLLDTLKTNADKTDYEFITKGNTYKKIADATHAYSDSMVAFNYMRSALLSYYYNISTPDKTNKKYRVGWLNRAALPFTLDGLYIPLTVRGASIGLKYESLLSEWDDKIKQLVENKTSGYVKIFDWGTDPESIQNMPNANYSYNYDPSGTNHSSFSSILSSESGTGAYGGCGNVYQLGNYTNAPNVEIIHQQKQNREEVLNTLMKGSYTPNSVKKCSELISSDKKKGVKTKSEN